MFCYKGKANKGIALRRFELRAKEHSREIERFKLFPLNRNRSISNRSKELKTVYFKIMERNLCCWQHLLKTQIKEEVYVIHLDVRSDYKYIISKLLWFTLQNFQYYFLDVETF